MSNAGIDIKRNNAKTKKRIAQIPCLVSVFNLFIEDVNLEFFCLSFFAIQLFYHPAVNFGNVFIFNKNQFLKCNLSSEASLANCSSFKKIIIGIPLLFSKLLRKAF